MCKGSEIILKKMYFSIAPMAKKILELGIIFTYQKILPPTPIVSVRHNNDDDSMFNKWLEVGPDGGIKHGMDNPPARTL